MSRVCYVESDVYRTLTPAALEVWHRLQTAPFFGTMTADGRIVTTNEVPRDDWPLSIAGSASAGLLRHERLPFITYPYEWPFHCLKRAALLHLDLLQQALPHGLILKDASPFNVQFRGSRPAFIDVGSFAVHEPGEPWAAYRQFCELMLFPLLLQAYRGVHFQPLLRGQLEGLRARQFLQWMRWRDLFRPGVLTNGWLHALLESRTERVTASTVRDLRSSGFNTAMIQNLLNKLRKLIERLDWTPEPTQWAQYDHSLAHVADDAGTKSDFVRRVCQLRPRALVWDLGCNDGRYARIASESAETVVGMDQDHGCVERLARTLDPQQTRIVPLCIDLANPSPALGWRGRERKRLEERGKPDLVLCLGLIHHLVIAANIPLSDVVDWLAELGGELILEFPSKRDAMVQALLRNKQDQYDDYSDANLERELSRHFNIQQKLTLPSGERTLLHAELKVPSRVST